MKPTVHTSTNRIVENGWSGNQPLPVTVVKETPGLSVVVSAWIPTREEQRLLRGKGYISLAVVVDNGVTSYSMEVGEVDLIPDRRGA